MFGRHGCGREPSEGRFMRSPFDFDRGRHGGRHGHFGRWMRGRILDSGDLRFIILSLVAEKPRHGYEIIKAIEDQLGGVYSPSPGVVYPNLTLLEEMGYISVTPVGNKKEYGITPEGLAYLKANKADADAAMSRLSEASSAYGSGPAPEIIRAMQNLRMALTVRVGKGSLSAEQVRSITAVLDRAASDIEHT